MICVQNMDGLLSRKPFDVIKLLDPAMSVQNGQKFKVRVAQRRIYVLTCSLGAEIPETMSGWFLTVDLCPLPANVKVLIAENKLVQVRKRLTNLLEYTPF
jgi:hypothetical protein